MPTLAAGVLLVGVPVGFNVVFALLAARFDYPDVLRRPTREVLAAFRAGGRGLVLLWWAFAATAALMVPLVVLLSEVLAERGAGGGTLALATTVGVLAAVVQLLGLLRWPFLVPLLARLDAEPGASDARRDAIDVVFQAFHRYLGVAVGEHLGYALTGAWTTLVAVAMLGSDAAPAWLGVVGVVVGPVLALCSLEFVGRDADRGWALAERLTPTAYVVWSLWLAATGVTLLVWS